MSSTQKPRPIRVLLTKLGLDSHDRGVIVVAMALRDAGMEVIYLGRRRTPEEIVSAAVQESVDVVGLSSLADAHNVLAPRVIKLLKERGAGMELVILGGFIQREDIPHLKEAGIAEVFGPGTPLDTIANFIKTSIGGKK